MTPTTIILPSGNTAENAAYAGPEASLSFNTETHRLRVHDGVTVGGFGLVLQSGDTLTGPLSFAGKNHAGIRLNNLSTLQRNLVNPRLPGMLIWNINTNQVEQVNQSLQWGPITGGVTPPAPPLPPEQPSVKPNILRRVFDRIRSIFP